MGKSRVLHLRVDGGNELQELEEGQQPPDLPAHEEEGSLVNGGQEMNDKERELGEKSGDQVVRTWKRVRKEKRDPSILYY